MGKRLWNWFVDKWLAGLLTAVITISINNYVNLPDNMDKREFFKFHWFSSFMRSGVPLWAFLLVIIFFIMFHILNKKSAIKKNIGKPFQPPKTDFINYRRDRFGRTNFGWTWDYEWDAGTQKYVVENPRPLCPVCDNPMNNDYGLSGVAICPKCRLDGGNSSYQHEADLNDIKTEVVRRVNSGEFRNSMSG